MLRTRITAFLAPRICQPAFDPVALWRYAVGCVFISGLIWCWTEVGVERGAAQEVSNTPAGAKAGIGAELTPVQPLELKTSWEFSDGPQSFGKLSERLAIAATQPTGGEPVDAGAIELPIEIASEMAIQGMEELEPGDSGPPHEKLDSANLIALRKVIRDFSSLQKISADVRARIEGVQAEFRNTTAQGRLIDMGREREMQLMFISSVNTNQRIANLNGNQEDSTTTPDRPLEEDVRPGRRLALREQQITQLTNQLIRHREQLRQLEGAERVVAMGRVRLMQEMLQLQGMVGTIERQGATFADRYWLHSDPERRFSGLEIQRCLYVLEQAELDDGYALITRILLHEKLGNYSYATTLCNGLIQSQSPLSMTARAIRVYLGLLQNRDEKKSSRAVKALSAEFKAIDANALRNGSIFDRWLLAEIYVLQGQWANAEKVYKQLKKSSMYEMQARRRLSQSYYHKSAGSPTLATKALTESQETFDLEPIPDWQSHTILALAHLANKNLAEAPLLLEQAAQQAQGDQIALIEKIRSMSGSEQRFDWDLFRIVEMHSMSEGEKLALDQFSAEGDESLDGVVDGSEFEVSDASDGELSDGELSEAEPTGEEPSEAGMLESAAPQEATANQAKTAVQAD